MHSIAIGRGSKLCLLSLYTFILIFQPPITRISQIYITGLITVMLLAIEGKSRVESAMRRTRANKLLVAVILMSSYLWTVNAIDMTLIDHRDLFVNRLRCFNQLAVLTSIQVAGIIYVLIQADKMRLTLRELLHMVLGVGALQAACALGAYLLPPLRAFFLRNADDIYQNVWMHERRGYGFSATLLDTFGYGIGIMGAILLCVPTKSKLTNILLAALLFFTTFFNSRTGIVVLLLAVFLRFICSGRGPARATYLALSIVALYLLFTHINDIIQFGVGSSSITVRWVVSALSDFYSVINNEMSFGDAQFVSGLISLSENWFEFLFGSGHSVYGTRSILGFATDIGYYNLLWIYGIIGTIIIYSFFIHSISRVLRLSNSKELHVLVIVTTAAFFLVQLKGNVIGASPGICLTYLILYSIEFYGGQLDVYPFEAA